MTSLSKLMSDIKSLPAANDLMTYIASQTVGGPSHGKQAILLKSSKLVRSAINFGYSNYLAAHMLKVYEDQKFTSFDFGCPEKNFQVLG